MNQTASSRGLTQAVVVGAVLSLFSIAILIASFQIDKDAGGGWGARIFPLFGAVTLLLVGLLELRQGLRQSVAAPTCVQPSVWVLLLLALGYVWLIGKIGYLLSTGLVTPSALWIFGIRRPSGLLLAAILCPTIYHLIFFELLGVFPPYGEWIDLLDILQRY